MSFLTELGCTVDMRRAPHLGDGVVLSLSVPENKQYAEVYLSQNNVDELLLLIMNVA